MKKYRLPNVTHPPFCGYCYRFFDYIRKIDIPPLPLVHHSDLSHHTDDEICTDCATILLRFVTILCYN